MRLEGRISEIEALLSGLDWRVFEVERGKGMKLVELAEGVELDEVKSKTEAKFEVAL